jgi:hypothetical protein
VRGLRYAWFAVPALGLVELCLHAWFAVRAPRIEEWRELASSVLAAKRAGEPVVVAPEWAEPLARTAFGDRAFPLAELARADDASAPGFLEVSALGARYAPTRSFRVVSEERHGSFTLRRLQNPAPSRVSFRFVDHVNPNELAVTLVRGGAEVACPFTEQARAMAGGLHGPVAAPSERFACPGPEPTFVAVTVIDDQSYAPRRCIWAAPPPGGVLRLSFDAVPLGSALRGFGGLSYFLFRDSDAPPVTLAVESLGVHVGSYTHQDAWGWHGFTLPTPSLAGRSARVELSVSAPDDASDRHFCFALEAVE